MNETAGPEQDPLSVEEVERLWQEAARCMSEEGFEVALETHDSLGWSLVFGGDPEARSDFDQLYERCVQPAETAQRRLAQATLPDVEEAAEMAKQLEACLAEHGVVISIDLEGRSSSKTVAAVIDALGYAQDDRTVSKDPRFSQAIVCLERYERLFPERFGSA